MARERYRPEWRHIPVNAPGANTQFSISNDRGSIWLVRTLTFLFTTDANVAARDVALEARLAEDVWFGTAANQGIAANTASRMTAYPGATSNNLGQNGRSLGWPTDGLVLPPGHRLVSSVTGMQAGDAFTQIFLGVVEYPDKIDLSLVPSIPLYEDTER